MKRSFWTVLFLGGFALGIVGCGGHSGGTVDVPLDENPYQVSDEEMEAMNKANSGNAEELRDQVEKSSSE